MISLTDSEEHGCRFVIRPNRSLTWRQCKLFFASIAMFSLLIATVFAVAGFWPVLPFAGAELLALWACLYMSCLGGKQSEAVLVDEDRVAVKKGPPYPGQSWEFSRAWAQVRLVRPQYRGYPSRLEIGSHGQHVELGAFLNEQERRQLAQQLKEALVSDLSNKRHRHLDI